MTKVTVYRSDAAIVRIVTHACSMQYMYRCWNHILLITILQNIEVVILLAVVCSMQNIATRQMVIIFLSYIANIVYNSTIYKYSQDSGNGGTTVRLMIYDLQQQYANNTLLTIKNTQVHSSCILLHTSIYIHALTTTLHTSTSMQLQLLI